jgi:hypothetical protein
MIATIQTNINTGKNIVISQASDGQIFYSEEYFDRVVKANRHLDKSCSARFIDGESGELLIEVNNHITIDAALYALCDITFELNAWESPQQLGY